MTTALTRKTPYEAMFNKRLNISHLCPFGSDIYILDESQTQSKLDPKVIKHIFVGYEDGPQAIRYYNPTSHCVSISRNYTFVEALGNIDKGVNLDELVDVIKHDLGDTDGNGDGNLDQGEPQASEIRNLATGTIIEEGKMMSHPPTNKILIHPTVEDDRAPVTSVPTSQHNCPQHT